MTTQEIAAELCKSEKGLTQVNIAQMCDIVKALKRKLAGRQCAALLKGLLAGVVLIVITGCAALPSAFTNRLDKAVKDGGAGQYGLVCTATKDSKQLVKVSSELECTADMIQLTGCHAKAVTFEGPK